MSGVWISDGGGTRLKIDEGKRVLFEERHKKYVEWDNEIFLDGEKSKQIRVSHEQGGGRTFVSKETPVYASHLSVELRTCLTMLGDNATNKLTWTVKTCRPKTWEVINIGDMK